MAVFLCNSFSLGMLQASPEQPLTLRVRALTLEEAKSLLQGGYTSAVGHPQTALVLSLLLGMEVPSNRIAITLSPGDRVVVFQIKTRLEEGRVLSEKEVMDLHEKGLTSFMLVEVVG